VLIPELEQAPDAIGEPAPLRFRLGRRTVEVRRILDRWTGRDHAYVKLVGSDGVTYILRHEPGQDSWRLVLFERPRLAEVQAAGGGAA
jgi:hypothetical protein